MTRQNWYYVSTPGVCNESRVRDLYYAQPSTLPRFIPPEEYRLPLFKIEGIKGTKIEDIPVKEKSLVMHNMEQCMRAYVDREIDSQLTYMRRCRIEGGESINLSQSSHVTSLVDKEGRFFYGLMVCTGRF